MTFKNVKIRLISWLPNPGTSREPEKRARPLGSERRCQAPELGAGTAGPARPFPDDTSAAREQRRPEPQHSLDPGFSASGRLSKRHGRARREPRTPGPSLLAFRFQKARGAPGAPESDFSCSALSALGEPSGPKGERSGADCAVTWEPLAIS